VAKPLKQLQSVVLFTEKPGAGCPVTADDIQEVTVAKVHATRISIRQMSMELGIPKSTIQKVLSNCKLDFLQTASPPSPSIQ
jgi:hypothetical protein